MSNLIEMVKKPVLCTECNVVWEHEKKKTSIKKKQLYLLITLYYEDFPKIDLDKVICDDCREEKHDF